MHWIGIGILIGVGLLLAPIILELVINLFMMLWQLYNFLMNMAVVGLIVGLLIWGIVLGFEQVSQSFEVQSLMRDIVGGMCILGFAVLMWLIWYARERTTPRQSE